MARPVRNATVVVHIGGIAYYAHTAGDGFFRIECQLGISMSPGLHEVSVYYLPAALQNTAENIKGTGWVMIPHKGQLAFISDIDDTFLVSHSANVLKRLYVLLSKNAHSRKPFDGVVRHYQMLAKAQTKADGVNPFFYVSSSEWNLYDFIKEFCRKNELPEGVYLLSQLKNLTGVFRTGSTKHATKFMRISRILEAFPGQRFVLLGDDSQMDPNIYAAIVSHFPDRIEAVYLRNVYKKNIEMVKQAIGTMQSAGVNVCHFQHSAEAILHTQAAGIID